MVDVVLGAGGPTGFECVKALLEQGRKVRAVVRDPAKYADKFPTSDLLEVTKGDVTDAPSLKEALRGANGVIFAASATGKVSSDAVDNKGLQNTTDAAKELGVKRVVVVSSGLVDPKNRWNPIRLMLNNVVNRGIMDAKFKGEEYLRGSGVQYSIVRPGRLVDGPPGKVALQVAQGDTFHNQVSRADVGAVCAAALTSPKTANVTFELGAKKPEEAAPQGQLDTLFDTLKPDKSK